MKNTCRDRAVKHTVERFKRNPEPYTLPDNDVRAILDLSGYGDGGSSGINSTSKVVTGAWLALQLNRGN